MGDVKCVSSASLSVDEGKAERVGALAKSAQAPRALAGVVDVGAGVAIDERAGQGAVDEDGQLARGRGEGLGLAAADGQPAVEGAEGGLAPDQPQGGHAEDGGGAIGRGLGLRAEAPAPGHLVLWRAREPGGEVMLAGPAGEVGADLGDELEDAVGGEAIDLREVDAGEVVEGGPDVDVGFVAVAALHPWGRQRRRRGRDGSGQRVELGVDGGIAGGELGLPHVKELEMLLQDKEMFGPVVTGQGGGDLLERGFAVGVPVLGEDVRVTVAGHEGAQNLEARQPDEVADDERQLEVHRHQCLVHPSDVVPRGVDEDVAVADEGAEGQDGAGGAEAAA